MTSPLTTLKKKGITPRLEQAMMICPIRLLPHEVVVHTENNTSKEVIYSGTTYEVVFPTGNY